ncbi:MAG: GspH/FimT family protein [bacterium]|nr:GspH/FimT family protein [bacterium]
MAHRDDKARRGGFTLVELMIVIVIVGIVVTLAVSTFRGMNEKYRVEGETKQMFADMMDARGRAMQRSRMSFVKINAKDYSTYEDTSPAPDGDGALDNTADTLVANVTVSHTIVTDNIAAVPFIFRFNRNGIASVTGFIRFSSTAQPDYDCITINPTRIKMGQYLGGVCVEK